MAGDVGEGEREGGGSDLALGDQRAAARRTGFFRSIGGSGNHSGNGDSDSEAMRRLVKDQMRMERDMARAQKQASELVAQLHAQMRAQREASALQARTFEAAVVELGRLAGDLIGQSSSGAGGGAGQPSRRRSLSRSPSASQLLAPLSGTAVLGGVAGSSSSSSKRGPLQALFQRGSSNVGGSFARGNSAVLRHSSSFGEQEQRSGSGEYASAFEGPVAQLGPISPAGSGGCQPGMGAERTFTSRSGVGALETVESGAPALLPVPMTEPWHQVGGQDVGVSSLGPTPRPSDPGTSLAGDGGGGSVAEDTRLSALEAQIAVQQQLLESMLALLQQQQPR
jgi:hypothetical protein